VGVIVTSAESEELEGLIRELRELRSEMIHLAEHALGASATLHPTYRDSARNLLHYVALRRHDLRPLQSRLAALGLSSLGRAEAHVLGGIDAVLRVLHQLVGRSWQPPAGAPAGLELAGGRQLLDEHTRALLGPTAPRRRTHIMVTMPSEAADEYTLVHDLLKQGMSVMRINCAHDGEAAWARMIGHLRRAEESLGLSCRVLMDLGGPKLRTGSIEPGPPVVRLRPRRDVFGRVTAPARVWLTAQERPRPPLTATDACVPVPLAWLRRLVRGDEITLTDTRRAKRRWRVADVTPDGVWAEALKTAYVTTGTRLRRRGEKAHEEGARVGRLPGREGEIMLNQGDLLVLTRDPRPGRPATRDAGGQVLTPAHLGCTLPEVFDDVRAGEPIWLDDGKIGGVLERVEPDRLHVRVTRMRPRGEKLRSDKGINLPESALRLPALTARDVEDLEFVARHADLVGLSFANSATDVEALTGHLGRFQEKRPGIVLKIETRRGFEHLPAMLLAAMRTPGVAVMIARGDLAVECGFERLAEVQEEILWICEAAHCPVIWATQVLETLAKEGMPSRAEITDAAMAHRAECVMLNKGPHVVKAVQALDDILQRMEAHQTKKRAMLRELRLARSFAG
jgi:pyruvate kinase